MRGEDSLPEDVGPNEMDIGGDLGAEVGIPFLGGAEGNSEGVGDVVDAGAGGAQHDEFVDHIPGVFHRTDSGGGVGELGWWENGGNRWSGASEVADSIQETQEETEQILGGIGCSESWVEEDILEPVFGEAQQLEVGLAEGEDALVEESEFRSIQLEEAGAELQMPKGGGVLGDAEGLGDIEDAEAFALQEFE